MNTDMSNPTVTVGFRRFLESRKKGLPGEDLIDRYLQHGPENLETQINAAQDHGEPVAGRHKIWTDGDSTWFNIRIPKGSYSDKPHFDDYELRWAPEEHCEAIGATGWDWKRKVSCWVGFDFDDITGHAKGVGITDEELRKVEEAAKALDYVEVRVSTGQKGIHLYVLLAEIPTKNHNEHAALARCILGMMSAEVNLDFASAVDACGKVMWIWRRDIKSDGQGLKLLKVATRTIGVDDLPSNWRDHIDVVTRRANKIKLQGVTDKNRDPFDELTSSVVRVPLDDVHKATIDELMDTGYSTIWVSDYHLLQTHSKALEALINDPEICKKLSLIGCFQTNSPGKDKAQPNCFLFPIKNGAWHVYRFSQGVAEAPTWMQDGEGWTTCYFNHRPDFETACRAYGGLKDPEKNEYVFDKAGNARKAAEVLGKTVDISEGFDDRPAILKIKNDSLVAKIERKDSDDGVKGWLPKKKEWIKEVGQIIAEEEDNEEHLRLRALRTPQGESADFIFQQSDRKWAPLTASKAKLALQGLGANRNVAETILGKAIAKPWTLVNLPFQPEFPGGRQYNRATCKFRVKPREGEHPAWDKIYKHLGRNLTKAIQESPNPWFEENNVRDGATYLFYWLLCALRDPFESLPYLALIGGEEVGKSTYYESVMLYLLDGGVVKAERSLTSGFNGELEGAVIGYVEELDVSGAKVRARMKDLITSPTLAIRRMRTDQYHVPNTTHIIQCANSIDFVPNWPHETRITLVWVDLPKNPIPRIEFRQQLEEQAPAFLYTLLNTPLPSHSDRLRIPIVETEEKLEAAKDEAPVARFLVECCVYQTDSRIAKDDLYSVYCNWCADGSHTSVDMPQFSKYLQEFSGNRIKTNQKTLQSDGKRKPAYTGVAVREDIGV